MLTREELEKYKACLFMESVRPEKIKQTDVLDEQIHFLRTHGENRIKFYSTNWFTNNPKVTRKLYFQTYANYSKAFNKLNQKYIRAEKKRKELEAKLVVQEQLKIN